MKRLVQLLWVISLRVAAARKLRQSVALLVLMLAGSLCHANNCAPATSAGTAPSDWASYCWLDFTGFNAATATSGSGQTFNFTLNDGSVLTMKVKATNNNVKATAAPSWSGAAMGNTAYIGIPGSPVLYTTASGNLTLTLSSITVTPPGVPATAGWMIIAADAESTNSGESVSFTTNGAAWTLMQSVSAGTGIYPTLSGVNTNTVSEAGVGGTVGSYIFGSTNSPTTVSSTLVSGGLQGVMFAVRYAWISANSVISGTRLNVSDQFKYAINLTANGSQLVANTSTGAGTGPFTPAQVTVAAGYPITLVETMAVGSSNPLSAYSTTLTCTNANAGSATVMPSAVATTSFNMGTLAYSDGVTCQFTNTGKRPTLTVTKISEVISDPVNGASNPKRIPGSVVRYTINVSNSGPGPVDASTLVMSDAVPANTALCVATTCNNPVVEFIDGTPASGLAFVASNVTYSNTAGGGAPFTYTPVPNASGFDAAVTGLRIALTGTLNAASGGNPGFSIRFRVKVQ